MLKSQRLIQLIMVINVKKSFTVPELAKEFGLSTRTITRDLEELSTLGVPIYSVQGRGGGYRLLRERMLPPITFTESEAVAMFFACQSLEFFGSLPFGEGAATALNKFYHYLPADVRQQIERLRNKVAIWSPFRSMSSSVLQTLLQAVMLRSAVTITYKSGTEESTRDIQPIGLYASQGYWYCPAFCFRRYAYRLFRADRILTATTNPSIQCLDEVDERTVKDWDKAEWLAKPKKDFVVSFTPSGVQAVLSNGRFAPYLEMRDDASALARIQVPVDNISFYVNMIWALGEEAEIVEPPEAVEMIRQRIKRMNNKYNR
ncbi:hypothetical protein PAESOLCIP111_05249 [Paenibacillus solanacearum]|uniref:HTH deoR-type domain-containing protein n=1 Tax=Paenibacillus solanacearum TaxID=2048548 RepID=A0A916NRE2_9BACL|nr:YafY family protein [Paenibacillus solanacearum]CAG7646824.1 hypothetical protein PAESOLCIP111_05249 [Paenibacillus solanacearum]